MYTKLKRSIVQLITLMGLAMVITGLLGLSPAQASDTKSTSASSASDTTNSPDTEVSAKTDTSTVSGDVADVLTANAGFIGKSKKVKACKAYAEKLEQQAPPRDPQALCEGDLKVRLYGKIVAACPTGYLGAKVTLLASLRQTVKARAFAKSIASGRVRTWAEFKIRDLAKIKGKTHIECVLIPVVIVTPPPTPVHDECPNIPGNQPVGYECTPPPPPVYDHCPNLPGDQPSGYICYPPVYDECPNIPGNQPVGYECTPPPVVTASVSCKLPPHLYFPNGNGLVFCQASKSNGNAVLLSEFSLIGDEYAHISQVEKTQYSDDANTPCPSGETCFRAQVWADKVGFANFVAKVLAAEWRGRMEVKADEF